jgi:hypothetical protein
MLSSMCVMCSNEMGRLACMVVVRNAYRIMVWKPQGRNYLEDLGIDGRKIFQCGYQIIFIAGKFCQGVNLTTTASKECVLSSCHLYAFIPWCFGHKDNFNIFCILCTIVCSIVYVMYVLCLHILSPVLFSRFQRNLVLCINTWVC